MPSHNRVKRMLDKRLLRKLGLNTVLLRSSTPVEQLDMFGEPQVTPWPFTEIPARIAIDHDKRDQQQTDIGGSNDKKREFIHFFIAGDADIQQGDKVVYPAGSDNQWEVDIIEPFMINDVCVINEVKAFRDPRY